MNGKERPSIEIETASEQGFTFAGFRLEPDGTLFRGQTLIHLPPKELEALRLLLACAGQIVTPQQLRKELWGDLHVTDDSVPKCISSLRARLEPEDCIQTVYKRGYRFSAQVWENGEEFAEATPRLAIMPFVATYGVPEHLGFAVAEETIARLVNARTALVSVLARDSVFNLAQRGLTAQQLGKLLKADIVLMGSLRALPGQIRLRAEMIRVQDDTQIWVEDLLTPQNRIAGLESELVERLLFRLSEWKPNDKPSLTGKSGEGLSIAASAAPVIEMGRSPKEREAFDLFLRAHFEVQSPHRHRMQDGLQRLLDAVELDPSLTVAHLDVVRACVLQAFYGFMSPSAAADQVRRTAGLLADSPEATEAMLPALGWISFHVDHDLPAALRAFSQSAHLPADPWNTRMRALLAMSRHRFAEAIRIMQEVLRDDPMSPSLHGRLAWTLYLDGQAGESMRQLNKSMSLSPNHEAVTFYGSVIFAYNGDQERADQLAQQLSQDQPYSDLATAVRAYIMACAERPDEARDLLEQLQWMGRERFVSPSFTPAVYVALGDHEAALAELCTAEESRCPWFFQILADPRLKPLHGHSEFQRLRTILTRMEAAAALEPQAELDSLQATAH